MLEINLIKSNRALVLKIRQVEIFGTESRSKYDGAKLEWDKFKLKSSKLTLGSSK